MKVIINTSVLRFLLLKKGSGPVKLPQNSEGSHDRILGVGLNLANTNAGLKIRNSQNGSKRLFTRLSDIN